MVSCKCIDNVELFNKLTHFENGTTDEKIFTNLLSSFYDYLLFKSVIIDLENIDIKKAECDAQECIYFIIDFNSKKLMQEFMDMGDTIEYKKSSYIIHKEKINNKAVKINFEKSR